MSQKHTLAIFFGLLVYMFSYSQVPVHDSASDYHHDLTNAGYKFYMRMIGEGVLLNNGPEYMGNYFGTIGSPFYGNENFSQAMVCYDHVTYYEVPIAYDLLSNEVVFRNINNRKVVLNNVLIDSLYLWGHKFVFLSKSENEPAIAPSLYDLIFNGKMQVYVKRVKKIGNSFKTEDLPHFNQYDFYIILKNGKYHKLTNKNSLMSLFDDRASDVQKMWTLKKLDYKKDPEKAILESVIYYESFIN